MAGAGGIGDARNGFRAIATSLAIDTGKGWIAGDVRLEWKFLALAV